MFPFLIPKKTSTSNQSFFNYVRVRERKRKRKRSSYQEEEMTTIGKLTISQLDSI